MAKLGDMDMRVHIIHDHQIVGVRLREGVERTSGEMAAIVACLRAQYKSQDPPRFLILPHCVEDLVWEPGSGLATAPSDPDTTKDVP